MGYTQKTIDIIRPLLGKYNIRSVCDLGAQNNYSRSALPAPYISEWYGVFCIHYMSIDLSGQNNSKKWDLSTDLSTEEKFDLVADAGTGEHVASLYGCLKNIDKLCKVGGIIYRENPITGNWPGHGFHYMTTEFYAKLIEVTGYELLHMEEHPACGNTTDGWNLIVVMRKTREGFIEKKDFPIAEKV